MVSTVGVRAWPMEFVRTNSRQVKTVIAAIDLICRYFIESVFDPKPVNREFQSGGLKESSRRSQRSEDLRVSGESLVHPEGVQHAQPTRGCCIPSGCPIQFLRFRWSSLRFDHRLLSCSPSGCRASSRSTARHLSIQHTCASVLRLLAVSGQFDKAHQSCLLT